MPNKTKKFVVGGTLTVGVYVEVFAKNATEAAAKAELAGTQRLCHQCAHGSRGDWSLCDGLNGEIETIEVDDAD